MEGSFNWKNVLYEKVNKNYKRELWSHFEIPVSSRKKNLTDMNINPYQIFTRNNRSGCREAWKVKTELHLSEEKIIPSNNCAMLAKNVAKKYFIA